jgi:hypothetical protein
MNGVSGEARLRPFPALDPEPPRRITWKNIRWPALGCVVAAAVVTAVLLTWPSSPKSQLTARFTDSNGVIVFEQQPSGTLGTAAPDGGHRVMLTKVGGLQSNEIPVASSDGRYLVDDVGELVTMGPAGPASITRLPQSLKIQLAFYNWSQISFADGSKYVDVVVCDNSSQYLYTDLIPTAGGPDHRLGNVTSAVGDPQSAGALLAPAPADNPSATEMCASSLPGGDESLDLVRVGQAPRTVVTAADLGRVLGVPPRTPVELSALPSPDGSLLAVNVTVGTPHTATAYLAARRETIVMTRAGKIVGQASLRRSGVVHWSPDGRQIASCQIQGLDTAAAQPAVTIWTVGGPTRTIPLPGHHDFGCDQLLWSPDGRQLAYSARVSDKGLTASANLQHGWTVIDLRSGQVHDVTAPGQPVVWLPASGGTR